MSLPAFGVRNPVPVNLLMAAFIIAGIGFGLTLRREFFPESDPDQAVVTLPYPGATPQEVEESLAIKVEDVLIELDEVKELRSTLSEGGGMVTAEFHEGIDPDEAYKEVEREVDALTDLPDEAESLQVQLLEPRLPVIQVAIYGNVSERALKQAMRGVKDDLRELPDMGELREGGAREYEIRVEVRQEALWQHGLSLPQVTQAVREAMRELPSGTVRSDTSNIKVRTLGVAERAETIADIPIKSMSDGSIVRLGEIANVSEDFVEGDSEARYNGYPSAVLTIYRVTGQDIVTMAEMVRAYVQGRHGEPFQPSHLLDYFTNTPRYQAWLLGKTSPHALPSGAKISAFSDLAVYVEGRLDLLIRNALAGTALVFLTLLFFLNWRVAVWVGIGLVTAISGTIVLMGVFDVTLNLLTMFGLIVVIGLLVDDGIVVAENIQTHYDRGEPPKTAAIKGANQVAWPVVATVLTSIVAFLPLTYIKGRIGTLLGALPAVVACALAMSLVESLLILPCHMAHTLESRAESARTRVGDWIAQLEQMRDYWLMDRAVPAYAKVLDFSLRWRYVSVAVALAVLLISLGMVQGQRVVFTFLPENDAETVVVDYRLPIGSSIQATQRITQLIEQASRQEPDVQNVIAYVGRVANIDTGTVEVFAPHVGQIFLELKPTDQRTSGLDSNQINENIRQRLGHQLDELERISFRGITGGPSGAAITLQIKGVDDQAMIRASQEIQQLLSNFAGVYDIADNNDLGQLEIQVTALKPGAEAMGFTRQNVAMQIRGFLFGLDAHVFAANREDIDVRIRMDDASRASLFALRNAWLISPTTGQTVPLSEIAELEEHASYATLRRVDRRRTITVTADVAPGLSPERIVTELNKKNPETGVSPLGAIRAKYPKLRIEFAGRQEQMADAFASLPYGAAAAALMIYVILAWLFASYFQPLIVMLAIPFEVIGVIWGHFIMGYDMTFLSMIGIVALSGIVVNDSLIYVEFYNDRRREGHTLFDALVLAGRARFRPILLTTITTVLGLMPLITETSFQARFLIPMGIAIAFGLMSATFLILLVLPCFLLIFDDIRAAAYFLWHGEPRPEELNFGQVEATD